MDIIKDKKTVKLANLYLSATAATVLLGLATIILSAIAGETGLVICAVVLTLVPIGLLLYVKHKVNLAEDDG